MSKTGSGESVIDFYIDTDSEEENEAATNMLEALDIEGVVRQTLSAVHVEQPVALTLVISGEKAIQALNKQYRQQDKPTDVLSFPLLERPLVQAPAEWLWQRQEESESGEAGQEERPAFVTPGELGTNLGDIIISWPTALRQAHEAGHSATYELLFLLCHGVLHLLGYDDQTEAGYREMVRQQEEILARFFEKG